jgi:anti-sigma regulatory factor (Ser/Thr protein kinase)
VRTNRAYPIAPSRTISLPVRHFTAVRRRGAARAVRSRSGGYVVVIAQTRDGVHRRSDVTPEPRGDDRKTMEEVSIDLPASPSSVGTARQFVRRTLFDWSRSNLVEPAALMTSELVTNAVQYSPTDLARGNRIAVRVLITGHGVRIEVDDDCTVAPVRRAASDQGGRGLTIVDTMSTIWGTRANQNGKTVWFELDQ